MKQVLTTTEAAQELGIASQTLEKWRTYGKGPTFVKVGRNVRYRMADLEAWLSSRVVNSTSAGFALDARNREG